MIPIKRILCILLTMFCLVTMAFAQAITPNVDFILAPDRPQLKLGEMVNCDVIYKSYGQNAAAASVTIKFDPSKVTINELSINQKYGKD
ncbi:MAG: hypothetical protein RR576_11385, partial [Oscillospiraceae bacterium]